MTTGNYYDIDDILTEEELVPCTTLFDFSYLSHLDPDLSLSVNRNNEDEDDELKQSRSQQHHLPEGSRIKMPLWSIEKWSMLGFVRLSLPRHYGRKARERLDAAPSEINLRRKNERFYMSGYKLISLLEASSEKVAQAIAASPRSTRNSNYSRFHNAALQQTIQETMELRQTLLITFTGERLRQTLDWSMSVIGGSSSGSGADAEEDDVTSFTNKLTELERQLFAYSVQASIAHLQWKVFGNKRRIMINHRNKPSYQQKDVKSDNRRRRYNNMGEGTNRNERGSKRFRQ